jgi:hypothetical protein
MDEIKHPNPFQLKIIQLDCPYEQFENPEVRKMFGDLIDMRKRGYSSRHAHGALPVDTYDFIGTHYLIASESNGEIHLLGGLRMVQRSMAMTYNLPFPIVSLLSAAKADRHLKYMDVLYQQYPASSFEFTYISSWSFDPGTREQPELVKSMYDLLCTIAVYSLPHPSQEVRMACGIPRLKTDQYIISTGFERAADDHGVLPEVHQSSLTGEPVVILELKNGHQFAYRRLAQMNEQAWKDRVIMTPAEIIERKKAA